MKNWKEELSGLLKSGCTDSDIRQFIQKDSFEGLEKIFGIMYLITMHRNNVKAANMCS